VVSVCIGADLWKYGGGLIHFSSSKVTVIERSEEEGCSLQSLQRGMRIVRLPVGSGAKPQPLTVILLYCSAMKRILEQKCELFGLVAG